MQEGDYDAEPKEETKVWGLHLTVGVVVAVAVVVVVV